MNMIDIKAFKDQITDDMVICALEYMGAALTGTSGGNLIFRSICHHGASCDKHKPHLWYYPRTATFFCWSCHFSGDIISLVCHVHNVDFRQAIAYLCDFLHINATENVQKKDERLDKWQTLKRWLPDGDVSNQQEVKEYDKSVLRLFKPIQTAEWAEYGITEDVSRRFNIGWYDRLACVTIPVFFNDALVGIRGRFTRQKDLNKGKYRPISTLDGTIYKFPSGQVLYGYDQNKDAIRASRSVFLFESEKSVLKCPKFSVGNSLAVFGSNITKRQIELLLELEVNDVVLAFDSDYHTVGDAEFEFFRAKMQKLIAKLKPYFSVSLIYNNQGYDGYKFSPVDFTEEQFHKLYKERAIL